MNEDITAVLFLVAIVQIVFLYYFFKMCTDVTRIKKAMNNNQNDNFSLYTKYLAFGNSQKAKEALEDFIWAKMVLIKHDKTAEKERKDYYDVFRKTYEPKLNDLGGSWPDVTLFK